MFRTTAEAKGEGFDPVKLVKSPRNLLLPFQGGTSVVVPLCYMSYMYVCGLLQYGQLNNSCPLCFLFYSVL